MKTSIDHCLEIEKEETLGCICLLFADCYVIHMMREWTNHLFRQFTIHSKHAQRNT